MFLRLCCYTHNILFMSHRIVSDIVVPKHTVASQMFHDPPPRLRAPSRNMRRKWKIIFSSFIIFGVWVLASLWFARMEARVTSRTTTIALNAVSALTQDPREENKLFMRTLSVNDVRDGIFPGSFAVSSVERHARGNVVIFNKSSQAPQVLIATTRLEMSDGKIYRIPQTITVPGYTRENGEMVPGSREVEVVADKPGAEYNIGLTDFVITGFKGSAKFETVFARSKTEMSGGFRGAEQTVRAEDLNRALIALRAEGEANAQGLVQAKVPEDMFLLKDSIEYIVIDQEVKPVADRNDTFQLVLRAEARGAIVARDEFVKLFERSSLPFLFRVANLEDLNITLEQYHYEGDPGSVRVSGDAILESLINTDAIQAFIAERRVSSSRDVLGQFAELESVTIRFRPFWFKRVPSDSARIDIIPTSR